MSNYNNYTKQELIAMLKDRDLEIAELKDKICGVTDYMDFVEGEDWSELEEKDND